MAGPLIGGRRPISWRLAGLVAVVVLSASNAWLKGIFGYGEIATDIPFLLFGLILFFTWRINRRAPTGKASCSAPPASATVPTCGS